MVLSCATLRNVAQLRTDNEIMKPEILKVINRVAQKLMSTEVILEQYLDEKNDVLQGGLNVIEDCYDELMELVEKSGVVDVPIEEEAKQSEEEGKGLKLPLYADLYPRLDRMIENERTLLIDVQREGARYFCLGKIDAYRDIKNFLRRRSSSN